MNKMSDIFTLPFVMKEIEKDVDGISTIAYILVEDGGKKSYNTAMLGYEWNGAQAIVDGLNAHDKLILENKKLVDALRPFAKLWKDFKSGERILGDIHWELAHTLVTSNDEGEKE